MNRQEWLDAVTAHLRSLPHQAMQERSNGLPSICVYETPEGLCCAIGFRIPKGHIARRFGGGVRKLVNTYPDLAELWDIPYDSDTDDDVEEYDDCMDFLNCLQIAHDNYCHWDSAGFNDEGDQFLARMADTYDLTYTPRP